MGSENVVETVKLDDVIFKKDLYPRFELDNAAVNRYRPSLDQLPPIIISKNGILIDGYHRMTAHRLEKQDTIKAIRLDLTNETEIFIEAIRRNSTHGQQLNYKEKQKIAVSLYTLSNENGHKITQENIADILSVGRSSVTNWLGDLLKEEKEKRENQIFELWLNCTTNQEIADKFGYKDDSTITKVVKKVKDDIFHQPPEPSNLQYYNTWPTFGLDPDQMKYPGQTPIDLVENIVWLNTELFGKVVDPMAGSGVVRQACINLKRRYLLYDIRPVREDIPIEKNDILKGLPDKARGADLVFFDPPYRDIIGKDYPDNEFTKSPERFIGAVQKSFGVFDGILGKGGRVAMMMTPQMDYKTKKYLDLTFECAKAAEHEGFSVVGRISNKADTQVYKAYDMTRAKEGKYLLNVIVDVVLFSRKKEAT